VGQFGMSDGETKLDSTTANVIPAAFATARFLQRRNSGKRPCVRFIELQARHKVPPAYSRADLPIHAKAGR
jgi:hypothetical protein